MANKYVALLLVVCLIATVTVDAQESLTPCLDHCIADNCGVHPSYFCVILCNFGCSSSRIVKRLGFEEGGLYWCLAPLREFHSLLPFTGQRIPPQN
ncbi:hypothetical protein ACSQ67_013971 [Phaseolus vulgaris]